MPDFAMCAGINCRICDTCYRYLAIPNRRQTYIGALAANFMWR